MLISGVFVHVHQQKKNAFLPCTPEIQRPSLIILHASRAENTRFNRPYTPRSKQIFKRQRCANHNPGQKEQAAAVPSYKPTPHTSQGIIYG
jgi:hypothetical protein